MGRACTRKREKGSGPIDRRGWESCSRLLPLVWAGQGWTAKLVVPRLLHQVRGGPSPRAEMLLFPRGVVLSVAGTVNSHLPPPLPLTIRAAPPHLTPPTSPGQAPATAPPTNEDQGSGHTGFWIRTSFCPHEKNSMVTHLC